MARSDQIQQDAMRVTPVFEAHYGKPLRGEGMSILPGSEHQVLKVSGADEDLREALRPFASVSKIAKGYGAAQLVARDRWEEGGLIYRPLRVSKNLYMVIHRIWSMPEGGARGGGRPCTFVRTIAFSENDWRAFGPAIIRAAEDLLPPKAIVSSGRQVVVSEATEDWILRSARGSLECAPSERDRILLHKWRFGEVDAILSLGLEREADFAEALAGMLEHAPEKARILFTAGYGLTQTLSAISLNIGASAACGEHEAPEIDRSQAFNRLLSCAEIARRLPKDGEVDAPNFLKRDKVADFLWGDAAFPGLSPNRMVDYALTAIDILDVDHSDEVCLRVLELFDGRPAGGGRLPLKDARSSAEQEKMVAAGYLLRNFDVTDPTGVGGMVRYLSIVSAADRAARSAGDYAHRLVVPAMDPCKRWLSHLSPELRQGHVKDPRRLEMAVEQLSERLAAEVPLEARLDLGFALERHGLDALSGENPAPFFTVEKGQRAVAKWLKSLEGLRRKDREANAVLLMLRNALGPFEGEAAPSLPPKAQKARPERAVTQSAPSAPPTAPSSNKPGGALHYKRATNERDLVIALRDFVHRDGPVSGVNIAKILMETAVTESYERIGPTGDRRNLCYFLGIFDDQRLETSIQKFSNAIERTKVFNIAFDLFASIERDYGQLIVKLVGDAGRIGVERSSNFGQLMARFHLDGELVDAPNSSAEDVLGRWLDERIDRSEVDFRRGLLASPRGFDPHSNAWPELLSAGADQLAESGAVSQWLSDRYEDRDLAKIASIADQGDKPDHQGLRMLALLRLLETFKGQIQYDANPVNQALISERAKRTNPLDRDSLRDRLIEACGWRSTWAAAGLTY